MIQLNDFSIITTEMIYSILLGIGSYFLWCFLLFRLAKKVKHPSPWMAFVPILNIFQFIQLAKLSRWWFLALLIPIVSLGISIWMCVRLSYNLGEKKGFGVLLMLPPVSFWALWKLGNTNEVLNSDDIESIKQIQQALKNNFPENSLKTEIIKTGITEEKANWLIVQAKNTKKEQTKTWVIVLLGILEIPLFLVYMTLTLFLAASPALFSILKMMTSEQHIEMSYNIQSETPQDNSEGDEATESPDGDSTKTEDSTTYDKVFELENVKIELDSTPQKKVDTSFGAEIDDNMWVFKFRVTNKTQNTLKVKTELSGENVISYLSEYQTKDLSIGQKIIFIGKINHGLNKLHIEISKCEGDCLHQDPQTVIEDISQDIWFYGFDSAPKFVSKEELTELQEKKKAEKNKKQQQPVFYNLKLIPDNTLIPWKDINPKERTIGVLVENNDTFPRPSGNSITCKVFPNNSSPYNLSDPFWKNFKTSEAFLVKEFPVSPKEQSGSITCKVVTVCPKFKIEDNRSRFCENKDFKEDYEKIIHTQKFSYTVSEKGEITIDDTSDTNSKGTITTDDSNNTDSKVKKLTQKKSTVKHKRRVRRKPSKASNSKKESHSIANINLEEIPFIYDNELPTLNKEAVIRLMSDKDLGPINWSVTVQPENADLKLIKSSDQKKITFTATKAGDYEITAQSVSNGSKKKMNFIISPELDLDESKIEGNDASVPVDELIGVITN